MENESTSIKQLIQGMLPEGGGVVEGVVVSSAPIIITLTNDSKMTLGGNSLIIPRHLTDYRTTVDISEGSINSVTYSSGEHEHREGKHEGHSSGDGGHEHIGGEHLHNLQTFNLSAAKMTVHNALKKGEIVYLLELNHGKRYYVLDRKG